MDLLMAGFQHNLLCHICSSSSRLPLFFFLEAALLSSFASSLSSIALMHLVRLSVSESQLSHFWIIEPSRVCCFFFFLLQTRLRSFSSSTSSSLSSPPPFFFFFFSWDSRPVFPISLLLQTLTSISFCVLMIGARNSWYPGGLHKSLSQFLSSLCTPGSCWEGSKSPSPQGFTRPPCTVISGYAWHSKFICAKWKHIYITISPFAKPTVSPECVRPEHKNKATTQREWPT